MKGIIKRVFVNKGFGFILGDDNKEYFLHFSAVKNAAFEDSISGHTIEFEPTHTSKGLRAEEVYLD